MIRAYGMAFAQLGSPEFRAVLWRALALSAGVFVALAVLVWWLFDGLGLFTWGWLNWIVEAFGWGAFLVVTWIFFPAVVSSVIGILLDDVVAAVERRHYPADPPGRPPAFWRSLAVGFNFALVMAMLNIVVLPLYLVLMFVPPLNFFVFYGLNGYLLGREYFELVALRQLDDQRARQVRKANAWRLFVVGAAAAFLFTIPFVNLLMPLVAAAAMVHIFKTLSA
ncbi:MAG: hypothetical protein FJX56_04215 [Alphaproteobacteria bacterium]|nr:hypothetical protein [Alphaproteobacteria bacterium]